MQYAKPTCHSQSRPRGLRLPGRSEGSRNQMHKWVPCDGNYITSDVVRWKQAIWSSEEFKSSKKKKVARLGERRVTAEVLTVDNKGFIRLSVMKDEILENMYGMPLKAL